LIVQHGINAIVHFAASTVEPESVARPMASTNLRSGGASATLNCGYGHGYSVRELIAAVRRCWAAFSRHGRTAPAIRPASLTDSRRLRQQLS
jgi:UDP-glucose 4-epimerase